VTRIRVATFNLENLRLRRDARGRPRLTGARDEDAPGERGEGAEALDPEDRKLTARVIHDAAADLVALQEVFDEASLDYFHDAFLRPAGGPAYPNRAVEEGNDGRGLDVAVMSRLELARVRSHAALTFAEAGVTPPDPDWTPQDRVFRRGCLEVDALAGGSGLTLFICHFKAMGGDRAATRDIRAAEARAVRTIVERRFRDPEGARWLIVGDLNDEVERDGVPQRECGIGELFADGFAVDLLARIADPRDRWTYHYRPRDAYTRPDHMLASPALARENPDAVPHIARVGMWGAASRYAGPRLPGVGDQRPRASDHALVRIDLEI
jgi:endonuclease/exonuclease/phosphatase family metal-dependent hydrolase